MALMRTINPVFVSFKRWVAENAQNRPELKVVMCVRWILLRGCCGRKSLPPLWCLRPGCRISVPRCDLLVP